MSEHSGIHFYPNTGKSSFFPLGLCFPLDLDAGTPHASFPQGRKGGCSAAGVRLLSPGQDFGTRDPNPALQGPFVASASPSVPKGDSSSCSSSQARITKDQTSPLSFPDRAWHWHPRGGVFGFVKLETKLQHL